MTMHSLKDIYIDQLQDLYSACDQAQDVTKELAAAAKDPALVAALQDGVTGIHDGRETLEGIIKRHHADPEGEHCKGMEGLVIEAQAHALEEDFGDADAQDAMIITQYQRMAHYAIAGYGCLVAFAKRLDAESDIAKLQTCLDKSYDGDRRMSEIAESEINKKAA